MVGEHGDMCVVELLPSTGDLGMVTFEAYYDTLRNTRDTLLKYHIIPCLIHQKCANSDRNLQEKVLFSVPMSPEWGQ